MRLLMEKLQSKKDVYNFLMQECEAYLPKMDTVNMFFLKQITSGKKEVRVPSCLLYTSPSPRDRG